MFLILTILIIIFSVIIYRLNHINKYYKKRGVKHEKPKLLFGNMYENATMRKHLAHVVHDMYMKFKNERYFGIFQFTQPTLVVSDLDLLKRVCIKDFDHFMDHQKFSDDEVDQLFSNNLFTMTGDKWRKMRPTLSPSFTGSRMRVLFQLMATCSKNFVQYYQDQNEDIIEVEMKEVFSRYANDVIATCAFGIEVDSLRDKTNEFYIRGKDITDFSGLRQLKFFLYNLSPTLVRLFKIKILSYENEDFFRRIINDTLSLRREKGIVRPDMIHLLLESQKGIQIKENISVDTGFATVEDTEWDKANSKEKFEITDHDIISQAVIFFLAGFDTSSNLMCFLAYELAVNKEAQDKLRKEIDATLTECNGHVTYEAVMKMKYMDMVISETLRKWPPAVATDRSCVKDYKIPAEKPGEKDLEIPKGAAMWIPIYSIHMDPKYYPNPEKFDPERFNDENKKNINQQTYLPFGVGPRICIGSRFALMQTKMIIFNLLKSFEIVPTKKSVIPIVIATDTFNFKGEGGIWLGFKKRKNHK